MDSEIEELADQLERLRGSDRTTAKSEDRVVEILEDVREEYEQLRGPDAYRQHVLAFVQAEREAFQEGERDEPLCECSIRCPVKRGRIPARVRRYDSIEEGIYRYQERHPSTVLLEAREAWTDKKARVRKALSKAKAEMKRNETHAEA